MGVIRSLHFKMDAWTVQSLSFMYVITIIFPLFLGNILLFFWNQSLCSCYKVCNLAVGTSKKNTVLDSIDMWVPISSTSKVSDGCIRDLGFNPRLHQKTD